jgi:hypothetical protein
LRGVFCRLSLCESGVNSSLLSRSERRQSRHACSFRNRNEYEKSFLWESGLGWRATAGQLLIPRLPNEPRLGRVEDCWLVRNQGNMFRCLGGSGTAVRTGLGPVGGRHTECACYLGYRTRSVRATFRRQESPPTIGSQPRVRATGLGAGSNSSALPKKGWATLGWFCAADILTPAYG